jgi:hypothetical protein
MTKRRGRPEIIRLLSSIEFLSLKKRIWWSGRSSQMGNNFQGSILHNDPVERSERCDDFAWQRVLWYKFGTRSNRPKAGLLLLSDLRIWIEWPAMNNREFVRTITFQNPIISTYRLFCVISENKISLQFNNVNLFVILLIRRLHWLLRQSHSIALGCQLDQVQRWPSDLNHSHFVINSSICWSIHETFENL